MFSRVLWMNNLGDGAEACLQPILALTQPDAAVTLAYAAGNQVGADHTILPAIQQRAEVHLGALRARVQANGRACTVVILPGRPTDVARRHTRDHGTDLIVAGSTGVQGLDRWLVGSTAQRLVRHLDLPVLIVGRRPSHRLDAILCPVDLDRTPPDPQIQMAAQIARAGGPAITFLHVLDSPANADTAIQAESQLRDRVGAALGDGRPFHWSARVIVEDSQTRGILGAARLHDLVVLRWTGRSGLERITRHSTTEDVLRSCRVSVLVAR